MEKEVGHINQLIYYLINIFSAFQALVINQFI